MESHCHDPCLVEFSRIIQRATESLDREIKPQEIYDKLLKTYQLKAQPFELIDYDLDRDELGDQRCTAHVRSGEKTHLVRGRGSGPIEAFVNGFGECFNESLNILDFREMALSTGKDAEALCIVSVDDPSRDTGDSAGQCYGIGVSANTITASLLAILSAANKRWQQRARIVA